MSRLILRRPSRLCFSNVLRQSSLSSFFSCNVFYKEKKSSVRNSCESFQKHDGLLSPTSQKFTSGYVNVGVCFGLVLGAVFAITSANNANCAGKEDSSAPCDDQEGRACVTPINSGSLLLRDSSSGRFSTPKKSEKSEQKEAQLQAIRSIKVEKAKRKLTMESDEDRLHESKRVTRGSEVSPLLTPADQCYNKIFTGKLSRNYLPDFKVSV